MRVMVVGSDKVYAIENFYVRYLREEGIEVYHFCAQSFFYDYYQRNIINKLLFKAGLSTILQQINRQFDKAIEQFRPDIIWVFKGMEIFPESLSRAKQRNILLVNYNPDNPFIFTGKGSGNKNVTDSIGLYQLHFTYNLSIKKRLEKECQTRTSFLPFGYDIDSEVLAACQEQEEISGVCFLGNPDRQRAALIMEFVKQGIKVDLYGHNWQQFIQHENACFFKPVYGLEFWKTLYRYRVQLNFMRIHNEDSHNMRTFEIPGVGAIQLAPDTPEHRMFFESEREIFLYNNINDCCTKARYLLSLSKEEATVIRNQARQRCMDSGYSYHDRARQALTAMNVLMNG